MLVCSSSRRGGSDVKEHNQVMSQNIIKLLLSTVLPVEYGLDL